MTLYVVATPIGNPDDLSLRASRIIEESDYLICEELKPGRRLLKRLGMQKEILRLNEHNENEEAPLIISLLKSGKSAALVSDAGTPSFADPGTYLVKLCHQAGIKVVPIPGPSSLMAALSVAGVDCKRFLYLGFLARKSEERVLQIRDFANAPYPVILYDTPYRLLALLEDLKKELGPSRALTLLFSLTQESERIVKGTLQEIGEIFEKQPVKLEFVLIVEPSVHFQKNPKKKAKFVKTRTRR